MRSFFEIFDEFLATRNSYETIRNGYDNLTHRVDLLDRMQELRAEMATARNYLDMK